MFSWIFKIWIFVLVSNNCLRSIRVSVSSSPYENEFIQKIETQSPSYSSIISNFFQQNFPEQTKGNKEEQKLFNHRPLLHLINQFNQENTFLQSQEILPSKQFSSFRPVSDSSDKKSYILFIGFYLGTNRSFW
jgi:hypothetical protein